MQKEKEAQFKKWIEGYFLRNLHYVIISVVGGLIMAGVQLLAPIPLKLLADNVFGSEKLPDWLPEFSQDDLILFTGALFAGIVLLKQALEFVFGIIQTRIQQKIDAKVISDVFEKLIDIPAEAPNRDSNGDLSFRVNQESQVMSAYILGAPVNIIASVLSVVAIIYVLTDIDAKLTLVSLAAFPFMILALKFFGSRLETKSEVVYEEGSKIYDSITESFEKLRTIQALVLDKVRLNKLNKSVISRDKAELSQTRTALALGSIDEIVVGVGTGLLIYYGATEVVEGTVSLGDLFIFIAYIDFLFGPLTTLIDTISGMSQQKAALKRVFKTVKEAEGAYRGGMNNASTITGKIEFKDVSYTVNNSLVFKDFSAVINPGETVAFIGPSGAGKSTVLNMIPAFNFATSGGVYIDDLLISQYAFKNLRRKIAIIDQSPQILDGTYEEAISLAEDKRDFRLLDVKGAAFAANASSFIREDFEKEITDTSLSGGQKQRIAIARAFYQQSPITIMDEPTSALDKKSAQVFRDNLIKYWADRTVVLVTHDLDLLSMSNKIFVVRDGTIKPIEEYGGLENYKQIISND